MIQQACVHKISEITVKKVLMAFKRNPCKFCWILNEHFPGLCIIREDMAIRSPDVIPLNFSFQVYYKNVYSSQFCNLLDLWKHIILSITSMTCNNKYGRKLSTILMLSHCNCCGTHTDTVICPTKLAKFAFHMALYMSLIHI